MGIIGPLVGLVRGRSVRAALASAAKVSSEHHVDAMDMALVML